MKQETAKSFEIKTKKGDKQMKKIISFAVALIMLFTMSSTMAFAAFEGAPSTVGTVADGYTPEGTPVSSVSEFEAMAAGGTYYLTKSLDFSGKTYTISVWNKTGALNLDGCGYSLTGITVNGSGDVGVFYQLTDANIKNLIVEASITTGTGACAGLTAISKSGATNFENVKLTYGVLKGGKLGGFCGYSQTGSFHLKNCEVNGLIDGSASTKTGENAGVGGFFGQLKKVGKIEYCTNNATIDCAGTNSASPATGGFIGRVTFGFIIENSVNNGLVDNSKAGSSNDTTGGFIGMTQSYNDGGTPEPYETLVKDCVNKANVLGGRDTGGIIGGAEGNSYKGIRIINCVNEGDVIGTTARAGKIGGIIAEVKADLTVDGCVNEGSVSGNAGTYADDGIGAIVGAAYNSSVNTTWILTNNTNKGIVTNNARDGFVSTLAAYTAASNVTAQGNTSTVNAVGTLTTAGKAYVQFKEADEGKSDIRFVLALDEAALESVAGMELKITIGERSVSYGSFGTLYRKLNAADIDIKGAEGIVLYGLVVTGVPDSAWSELSIELSATDASGAAIEAFTISGTLTK